jgi:pullulanase/glycogen debranching enzyme
MKRYSTLPGHRFPFGAAADAQGTNFSVWGRFATRVELFLYEKSDSPAPFQVIELDPEVNRSYYAWHVYVEGLAPGSFYGWRMDGPGDTRDTGFRFDKEKVLIDPWARAVTHELWDRQRARLPGDNGVFSMRSVVLGDDPYDWEGDEPLNHPMKERIFYEMHVDGFRFDLASVLARDQNGDPMYFAPTPWRIEFSNILANTAIIAEAWDAAGLYQVGDFPGFRWAEWNGQYRDAIRRFVRGERGLIGEVASRISGSSDLYEEEGRLPGNSINFVTWHGTKLNEPRWNNTDAQILAYTLGRQREAEEDLHIVFNMSDHGVEMPLPPLPGRVWHRAVDTGQNSPGDILEPEEQLRAKESSYPVASRSVVVFESR